MEDKQAFRAMVKGAYDLQSLRISMGLRLVANFKAKLGGSMEVEWDSDAKKLVAELKAIHNRLSDGVAVLKDPRTEFVGEGLIATYTEFCLVRTYLKFLEQEQEHFKRIAELLQGVAVYTEYLSKVKGIGKGTAIAAVIVSEFDIRKARYVSSLWKYAGLDVGPDGRGRSMRTEHLHEVEYTDKDGKTKTKMSPTFNVFLRTKLIGVLAPSFLRAGEGPYSKVYYDYRTRLENHERYGVQHDKEVDSKGHKVSSKGRRHNMAMRYMIKSFLADLYNEWKRIEGLPIEPPYSEAKLGHVHVA